MEEEFKFKLDVITNSRDGHRSFKDIESYRTWLAGERAEVSSWAIDQGGSGLSVYHSSEVEQFFVSVGRQIDGFSNSLHNYEATRQENYLFSVRSSLESIEQYHRQMYGPGKLFTSDSSEGKLLSKLKGQPGQAAGAFHVLRKAEAPSEFAYGLIVGGAFRLGLKNRAEAEGEALAELRDEWSNEFQTLRADEETSFSKVQSNEQEEISKLKSAYADLRREMEAALETQATQYHEHLASAESELRRLTELYRTQLGLAAPVQYWKSKAVGHRTLAIVSFFAVAASGFGFGRFFLSQVKEVLQGSTNAGTAEVIILLTLATLGVWSVRIFVRLFFSQVHLNTDARERAVMIETFLALLNRNEAKEEERLLVLNAIFRPSSTGIVKDDSAPPSLPEGLSRLLSK